jgi:hypothetical protein
MRGSPLPGYVAMALQQVSTLLHRKPMRDIFPPLFYALLSDASGAAQKNVLVLIFTLSNSVVYMLICSMLCSCLQYSE